MALAALAAPKRLVKRKREGYIPPKKSLSFKIALFSVMTGPFFASTLAMAMVWNKAAGPLDAFLLVFTYVPISLLGVCAGLHRHFTHGSFKAKPWLVWTMGICAKLALEGLISLWCAIHRQHHEKSDLGGDPHSPRDGFWHAHILWMYNDVTADPEFYVPDLLANPIIQKLDRQTNLWTTISFLGPVVLGAILGPVGAIISDGFGIVSSGEILGIAFTSAWHAFLWGSLVRIFLVHHVTWSVNSVGHKFGAQPYKTKNDDLSRNVPFWLVLPFAGFGEHNHCTHHADPRSARHGTNVLNDPTWGFVCIGKHYGWISDIYVSSPEHLRKLLKPGEEDPMERYNVSDRIIDTTLFVVYKARPALRPAYRHGVKPVSLAAYRSGKWLYQRAQRRKKAA